MLKGMFDDCLITLVAAVVVGVVRPKLPSLDRLDQTDLMKLAVPLLMNHRYVHLPM
jgi:hypothetical protein